MKQNELKSFPEERIEISGHLMQGTTGIIKVGWAMPTLLRLYSPLI